MSVKQITKKFLVGSLAAIMLLFGVWVAIASAHVTGAIFTTDLGCTGVDLNIYPTKDDVYIDGGPTRKGYSTGLPVGSYYVQVTTPDGKTVLGKTPGPTVEVNSDGDFVGCYQLSGILYPPTGPGPGYNDTTNPGGEYKVWISQDPYFANRASKTDNFKVGLDTDDDGVLDHKDNCPTIFNPDQTDGNGNGIGDACDLSE